MDYLNFRFPWLYAGLIGLSLSLIACRTTKPSTQTLRHQIETSPVFNQAFTGFALFDPATQRTLYQHNADKYFTPASNTKIFTLYTCLNILGDSLRALQYYTTNDSLIFTGTGDPSFLHPYLPEAGKPLDFLRSQPQNLYYCSANFQEPPFGPGWAWDDYPYYYQAEKSAFPIHGNVVRIQWKADSSDYRIEPALFKKQVVRDSLLGGSSTRFRRLIDQNRFLFNGHPPAARGYEKELPFKYSDSLFVRLLGDVVEREVVHLKQCPAIDKRYKVLTSLPVDTVYTLMMQLSDNFIAEQLLLVCSSQLFDTLSSRMAIDYAKQSLLHDLPDEPIWVDGSGLSRYNLFTPRSIVALLHKLYQEVPVERLWRIFPAGGRSGTIRYWYGGLTKPYVFAKTGTLTNKHCLSGYIKTKQGRVLIFSFMHNNFIAGSREYKKEMEKVLLNIYSNY